jgi:chorismate mutase
MSKWKKALIDIKHRNDAQIKRYRLSRARKSLDPEEIKSFFRMIADALDRKEKTP